MPFYGDNSDLKLAGTRIVLAELVIPAFLFTISGIFLATWVYLLGISVLDLIDFSNTDKIMILIPEIVMIYSFIDLLLACLLYSAVIQLNYSVCFAWIMLQVILLVALVLPTFVCPFFDSGLNSIFWEWILVCGIVYLYKIYRIRLIWFLMTEIKEEGKIWKHDSLSYE